VHRGQTGFDQGIGDANRQGNRIDDGDVQPIGCQGLVDLLGETQKAGAVTKLNLCPNIVAT
jgi:hypothetical protein